MAKKHAKYPSMQSSFLMKNNNFLKSQQTTKKACMQIAIISISDASL